MCRVWANANKDRYSVGNLGVCYVCGPGPTQELRVYEKTGGNEAPAEGPVC